MSQVFKSLINPSGTCRICHEPIEDVPWLNRDGTPQSERAHHRDNPIVTTLLCLDCKLMTEGWTPPADEGLSSVQQPEPVSRERIVAQVNQSIIDDERGGSYE